MPLADWIGTNCTIALDASTYLTGAKSLKITPKFASYDSKYDSISSQDTNPQGVFVTSDGTKYYLLGQANDRIYQYTIGTPYDISTGAYASLNKSISSQDSAGQGMHMNVDGTKFWFAGNSNDSIFEYTLGTSYNISTATHTGTKSVATEDATPVSVDFNSYGTKMYVGGTTNNKIYQYSLGTTYTASTATYDSVYASISETNLNDAKFNSAGTACYVVDTTSGEIYKHNLTTAWDLSTLDPTGISLDISSQDTSPNGLCLVESQNKIYVSGVTNDRVYQYSLISSCSITSAQSFGDLSSYTGQNTGTPSQGTAGLWVNNNYSIISTVKLKLGSDSSNYAYYTGSIYDPGSYGFTWQNGWTYLTFDLDVPDSVTGTPDWTACDYAVIEITFTNVGVIYLDYLTISKSNYIGLNGLGSRTMYKLGYSG